MIKTTHKYTSDELKAIHRDSFKNAELIRNITEPKTCGCFYCMTIFTSNILSDKDIHIEQDGEGTLLCPECSVDSVIVETEQVKVTSELLNAMNKQYF